jgi:hypothetical protein
MHKFDTVPLDSECVSLSARPAPNIPIGEGLDLVRTVFRGDEDSLTGGHATQAVAAITHRGVHIAFGRGEPPHCTNDRSCATDSTPDPGEAWHEDFHSMLKEGDCSTHAACGKDDTTFVTSIMIAAEHGTYTDLANLQLRYSNRVVLNADRHLLQMFDCRGIVVAQAEVDVAELMKAMSTTPLGWTGVGRRAVIGSFRLATASFGVSSLTPASIQFGPHTSH